jgi:hypothetical protein
MNTLRSFCLAAMALAFVYVATTAVLQPARATDASSILQNLLGKPGRFIFGINPKTGQIAYLPDGSNHSEFPPMLGTGPARSDFVSGVVQVAPDGVVTFVPYYSPEVYPGFNFVKWLRNYLQSKDAQPLRAAHDADDLLIDIDEQGAVPSSQIVDLSVGKGTASGDASSGGGNVLDLDAANNGNGTGADQGQGTGNQSVVNPEGGSNPGGGTQRAGGQQGADQGQGTGNQSAVNSDGIPQEQVVGPYSPWPRQVPPQGADPGAPPSGTGGNSGGGSGGASGQLSQAGILSAATAFAGCMFQQADNTSQQLNISQCMKWAGIAGFTGAAGAATIGAIATTNPELIPLLTAYGFLKGVGNIADAVNEWQQLNQTSQNSASSVNQQAENFLRDTMNGFMNSCDYAAALKLAQYLLQHPTEASKAPWLSAILPNLVQRAAAQAQIKSLLQQANATTDPAQQQQLLNQALAAAGTNTCLRKLVPSTPPRKTASTPPAKTASTPPPKTASTPPPLTPNSGASTTPTNIICGYSTVPPGTALPGFSQLFGVAASVCPSSWCLNNDESPPIDTGHGAVVNPSAQCNPNQTKGYFTGVAEDLNGNFLPSAVPPSTAATSAPATAAAPQACVSNPPFLPWGGQGSATITVSGGQPCGIGWHDTGATILDSMSVRSPPSHGSLKPQDQHVIIFTPASGYKGPDSFTLSMQEHNGGRRATLSVKVSVTIQ